jgi:hypothetical protein
MTLSFAETLEQVRWVLMHGTREFQRSAYDCDLRDVQTPNPGTWQWRPNKNGSVPPLWEYIQRMLGYLAAAPLKTRCAMVRVVLVAYSIDEGGQSPGTRARQQLGVVGCTNTTALRRLSSS